MVPIDLGRHAQSEPTNVIRHCAALRSPTGTLSRAYIVAYQKFHDTDGFGRDDLPLGA